MPLTRETSGGPFGHWWMDVERFQPPSGNPDGTEIERAYRLPLDPACD